MVGSPYELTYDSPNFTHFAEDVYIPIRVELDAIVTTNFPNYAKHLHINPRPAGVFSRTRPAGGGGGRFCPPPLPNSRTNRRSEAGEAAIESPEREDSNAHYKFSLRGHM